MLSPITPPSPAPSVMPGTLRSASFSEAAACVSSICRSSTVTDCGTSRSGVSNLAPVAARELSRSRVPLALISGSEASGVPPAGACCACAVPKASASAAARRLRGTDAITGASEGREGAPVVVLV